MQRAHLLVILSNAIVLQASQAITVVSTWMTVSWQNAKTMHHARMASMNIRVYVHRDSMDLHASMMWTNVLQSHVKIMEIVQIQMGVILVNVL
jgi:hypothetical protein